MRLVQTAKSVRILPLTPSERVEFVCAIIFGPQQIIHGVAVASISQLKRRPSQSAAFLASDIGQDLEGRQHRSKQSDARGGPTTRNVGRRQRRPLADCAAIPSAKHRTRRTDPTKLGSTNFTMVNLEPDLEPPRRISLSGSSSGQKRSVQSDLVHARNRQRVRRNSRTTRVFKPLIGIAFRADRHAANGVAMIPARDMRLSSPRLGRKRGRDRSRPEVHAPRARFAEGSEPRTRFRLARLGAASPLRAVRCETPQRSMISPENRVPLFRIML